METIVFDKVSKEYTLYTKGGLYLRDRVTHSLQRIGSAVKLWKGPQNTPTALEQEFLALKHLSFKISEGEAVGFIGRNGAGKSTILKLLAGVTKPSSGRISVSGKIAALIEVGAGFHPELTGRENIYMNGAILGMKKKEIDQCFNKIVKFSEIEAFIDTPVKHYSSGMYVRLGFAVAAHTNPDVFLIDEVLAVGDEGFQRKCLNVLADHRASGKTMIFVSHELHKIEEVCSRCIYIEGGEIRFDGSPRQAIARYRDDLMRKAGDDDRPSGATLGLKAQITGLEFRGNEGIEKQAFHSGDDLNVHISYRSVDPISCPTVSLGIYGPRGEHVAGFSSKSDAFAIPCLEKEGEIRCRLLKLPLLAGIYSVSVELADEYGVEIFDYQNRRYRFEILCETRSVSGLLRMNAHWDRCVVS
jgi:lipopolysaccharide transport system ATP-binding protein